jgi:hypothetical protein
MIWWALRTLMVVAIATWLCAGDWTAGLVLLTIGIDLQLPTWMFGVGMLSMLIVSGFGICLGTYELLRQHRSAAILNTTQTSSCSN